MPLVLLEAIIAAVALHLLPLSATFVGRLSGKDIDLFWMFLFFQWSLTWPAKTEYIPLQGRQVSKTVDF